MAPLRGSAACIICGQPRTGYRRCTACRRYREHFGVERPERLWGRRCPPCPHCGDPATLKSGYCSQACAIAAALGA